MRDIEEARDPQDNNNLRRICYSACKNAYRGDSDYFDCAKGEEYMDDCRNNEFKHLEPSDEVKRLRKLTDKYWADMESLRAENKRMKEALEKIALRGIFDRLGAEIAKKALEVGK